MGKQTMKFAYEKNTGMDIHISHPNVHTGLNEDLRCYCCNEPIVAKSKKSEKQIAHFAHKANKDLSEKEEERIYLGGLETRLHKIAKKHISEINKITLNLPYQYEFENTLEDLDKINFNVNKKFDLSFYKKGEIESQKLKEFNIIPDVICYEKNNEILIEIYVTHAIDEFKFKKIQENFLNCIQVDLSKLDRELTETEIKTYINNNPDIFSIINTNKNFNETIFYPIKKTNNDKFNTHNKLIIEDRLSSIKVAINDEQKIIESTGYDNYGYCIFCKCHMNKNKSNYKFIHPENNCLIFKKVSNYEAKIKQFMIFFEAFDILKQQKCIYFENKSLKITEIEFIPHFTESLKIHDIYNNKVKVILENNIEINLQILIFIKQEALLKDTIKLYSVHNFKTDFNKTINLDTSTKEKLKKYLRKQETIKNIEMNTKSLNQFKSSFQRTIKQDINFCPLCLNKDDMEHVNTCEYWGSNEIFIEQLKSKNMEILNLLKIYNDVNHNIETITSNLSINVNKQISKTINQIFIKIYHDLSDEDKIFFDEKVYNNKQIIELFSQKYIESLQEINIINTEISMDFNELYIDTVIFNREVSIVISNQDTDIGDLVLVLKNFNWDKCIKFTIQQREELFIEQKIRIDVSHLLKHLKNKKKLDEQLKKKGKSAKTIQSNLYPDNLSKRLFLFKKEKSIRSFFNDKKTLTFNKRNITISKININKEHILINNNILILHSHEDINKVSIKKEIEIIGTLQTHNKIEISYLVLKNDYNLCIEEQSETHFRSLYDPVREYKGKLKILNQAKKKEILKYFKGKENLFQEIFNKPEDFWLFIKTNEIDNEFREKSLLSITCNSKEFIYMKNCLLKGLYFNLPQENFSRLFSKNDKNLIIEQYIKSNNKSYFENIKDIQKICHIIGIDGLDNNERNSIFVNIFNNDIPEETFFNKVFNKTKFKLGSK